LLDLERIIEKDAAIINIANSNIIINDFVTRRPPNSPKSDGIAGTKNFLVAYTEMMEGIPKMMAVFRSTNPCLYFGQAPTRLLAPTTNKE
jgi:hypothetical protein